VNALANAEVGKYLGEHFVATYQKVGTFTIQNGQKQGGNVASYFTTPTGQVLHAVAGPVDAATLLRESRWVVEVMKRAQLEKQDAFPTRLKAFFRKVHQERLQKEHGIDPRNLTAPRATVVGEKALTAVLTEARGRKQRLGTQGQVHLLLASYPMVPIEHVYTVVFERILNQPLSSIPVVQKS
jgi:hypothetical protein